jgi:cysteine synthase A
VWAAVTAAALTWVKAKPRSAGDAARMTALALAADELRSTDTDRRWVGSALARLAEEARACPDTPMRELRLSGFRGIRFLLKDESAHPSGSLKHRLARSLFLYALCNGRLRPGQAAIDASSGSTAISEAWFARLLGVPFTAVMPRSTAIVKQQALRALGGHCELVDPDVDPAGRAREFAVASDACYLDQFGLAGSATDWRGNNNIAQSMLAQCEAFGAGDPDWIVCGAGTGGTSATIGRYLRYAGSNARLCVAEPTGAAFAQGWRRGDRNARALAPTCIEGIGRARVEPCFAFELVDAVHEVEDAASIAGALLLEQWTGTRYGGSSGTNLVAALALAHALQARGERGSIVLLLCDRGERYADTLFNEAWRAGQGLDPARWQHALARAAGVGVEVPGRG